MKIKKTSYLVFSVTGSSKKVLKFAFQDNCIEIFALNFSSYPGGKINLKCGNGGSLPFGVSRPSLTSRLQIYHSKKISE